LGPKFTQVVNELANRRDGVFRVSEIASDRFGLDELAPGNQVAIAFEGPLDDRGDFGSQSTFQLAVFTAKERFVSSTALSRIPPTPLQFGEFDAECS
jgi:hypothetical protein